MEPDNREKDYGYVQFKLYKEASYTPTKADVLEYLADATKIMLTMENEGTEITQTLILSSVDAQSAEYGLRSEKLKLVKGEYSISSFKLYDRLDEELYKGGAAGKFEAQHGTANIVLVIKRRYAFIDKRKPLIYTVALRVRQCFYTVIAYIRLVDDLTAEHAFRRIDEVKYVIK